MSKIITNPTDSDIKILFEGISYEVKGKESIEVSDKVAKFWGKLHGFLEISDIEDIKKEIETLLEESSEVLDEVVEEVKTKKVTKKSNK